MHFLRNSSCPPTRLRPSRAIQARPLLGLIIGLVSSALLSGCNGPLPFLSGGALEGPVETAPNVWAFSEDFGVIQLETRPTDPYSVNLAYTQIEGVLYLNAGDTETEWVKHITKDARVRLRKEGVIYLAKADRVQDASEIARFATAWTAESMFHRDPTELERVWIYRLAMRDSIR